MDLPEKRCCKCKQTLPVTAFWKDRRTKDGLCAACKTCNGAANAKYHRNNRPHINARRKQHRLNHLEREREKGKVRYWKNREKILADNKKWYRKYREKRLAYMQAYYIAHKPERTAYNQAYHLLHRAFLNLQARFYRLLHPDHPSVKTFRYKEWEQRYPEKARHCRKVWRKAHPEYSRNHNFRRRARLWNAPEIERIKRRDIYERDNGRCHICHRHVPYKEFTLDHILALSKGGAHTRLNLAVACRGCNSRMGAGRFPAQFRLLP